MVDVGRGENNVRWLSLLVALRFKHRCYPNVFRPPSSVQDKLGRILKPRSRLNRCLANGDPVFVELVGEQDQLDTKELGHVRNWFNLAFGRTGQLCSLDIIWVPPSDSNDPIPAKVTGEVVPNEGTIDLFRVREPVISFEIPLEPVSRGDGTFCWVGNLEAPPGIASFAFARSDGSLILSQSLQQLKGRHVLEIEPDLPRIASDLQDDSFTERFQMDWELTVIPEALGLLTGSLKRLFFKHYSQLSVMYILLSLFHSPRVVTIEDVSFLLKTDFRGTAQASRSELFGYIMELCPTENPIEFLDTFITNLETDPNPIFRQKALINSPLFSQLILGLNLVHSNKRLEPFKSQFPKASFDHNTSYLAWLQTMLNSVDNNVDEFISRCMHVLLYSL